MRVKQTPEENARADAYEAGSAAEREHTVRACAERDAAQRRESMYRDIAEDERTKRLVADADLDTLRTQLAAAEARAVEAERELAEARVKSVALHAERLKVFQMLADAGDCYATDCPFCGVECGEEAEPAHDKDDCPLAFDDLPQAVRALLSFGMVARGVADAARVAAGVDMSTPAGTLRDAIEAFRYAPHKDALEHAARADAAEARLAMLHEAAETYLAKLDRALRTQNTADESDEAAAREVIVAAGVRAHGRDGEGRRAAMTGTVSLAYDPPIAPESEVERAERAVVEAAMAWRVQPPGSVDEIVWDDSLVRAVDAVARARGR